MSVQVVILVSCSLSYALFLFWYGGRGRPMSTGDVDSLLERVKRNAETTESPFAEDLFTAIRDVAMNDDGREFAMVNLIRYRTKAVYPPGWEYGDSPLEADARYHRAVIPLLLKRACFPIFLGRPAGRFLSPDGSDHWDVVALVRYRSRRDFLGFCADVAGDRADMHKWAAIEKTQVFPVHVQFSLTTIRLLIAGILVFVVVFGFFMSQ